MLKLCIIIVLFGIVFSKIYKIEQPCSSAGGICAIKWDCPNDIVQKYEGLCPNQRHLGVECCHGVPNSYTCTERGGQCQNTCPFRLIDHRAFDCHSENVCCINV